MPSSPVRVAMERDIFCRASLDDAGFPLIAGVGKRRPYKIRYAILRAASGVAFALVYPSLVLITGKLVPRELRNTGQVLLGTSRDLAPIIGEHLRTRPDRELGGLRI